jgi:chorismate mutase/prephenate dehydratase
MNLLDESRKKINEIDKEMARLFEERMKAVMDVLKYKKQHNLPVFDEKREIELIKRNLMFIEDENLKEYYLIFFNGLLESSKKYQGDNYE